MEQHYLGLGDPKQSRTVYGFLVQRSPTIGTGREGAIPFTRSKSRFAAD